MIGLVQVILDELVVPLWVLNNILSGIGMSSSEGVEVETIAFCIDNLLFLQVINEVILMLFKRVHPHL